MPLALELAAARIALLSVEHIACRLDESFQLLAGGSRLAPPRQQTLSATLDWSYDLLPEPERRVFRRLSVFAGGWMLEAAERVCGDDQSSLPEMLDVLGWLIDRSLVVTERGGVDGVRYRLLEPVRQYAAEKLIVSGEEAATRTCHLSWCLSLAEEAEDELEGPAQLAWFARLDVEHDNLRAALTWSATDPGRATDGLRIGAALRWFWFVRGYHRE